LLIRPVAFSLSLLSEAALSATMMLKTKACNRLVIDADMRRCLSVLLDLIA